MAEAGGSDKALLRMVRLLAAEGWDCHVAFPAAGPMGADFTAAGATCHLVAMRRLTGSGSGWRWLAYLLAWPVSVGRLALLARRTGAAVVHSNSLHSWYGWAAALLVRRPHVWHAREIVVQSRAALALERFLARHFADLVVAMSEAIAAQLDGANVKVIRDEPSPEEYSPCRAGSFRAREGIPDGVPLVGTASRIDTWKGIDVLLEAVPHLVAARPDTVVVVAGAPVAGKEAYAAGLARQAAALGAVAWLGPRGDIAEMVADLDVLVQASTQPEPYGLAIVEALASGTPVVATAAGGPVEILAGAAPSAGRLVPPGDGRALAEAVLALLPPAAGSTEQRRARPPLRQAAPARWSEVFAAVAGRPPPPPVLIANPP
ncbi:MAG: glycosyltransferase family 4 protein [Acidimicrobiales bacterium]